MVRKTDTAEKAAEILDRFTNEIDVNMLLCGALGGLAAYGGIVPPFTRLLMMTSAASGGMDLGGLLKNDYEKAAVIVSAMTPGALLGGFAGTLIGVFIKRQLEDSGMSSDAAEIKAAEITQTATFASGALEGMLMYKAMSQPGVIQSVIGMPAEILKGLGAVVPG